MSFATGTYVVKRAARSLMVNGRAIPVAPTLLSVVACIQPASGRDLLQLPELQRSIESRVVYTTVALIVAAEDSANECDVLTIDGLDWQAQHTEVWHQGPPTGATAYRTIVQAVA